MWPVKFFFVRGCVCLLLVMEYECELRVEGEQNDIRKQESRERDDETKKTHIKERAWTDKKTEQR